MELEVEAAGVHVWPSFMTNKCERVIKHLLKEMRQW